MGRFDRTRAAVTGGGGFIGGALARALAAEGARVLALDVSPAVRDGLPEGADAAVCDITEAVLLAALRGAPGAAYTAWEGVPVTFREYFSRIAEIAGSPPPRRLPRPVLEAVGRAMELWSRAAGTPPPFTSRSATFIARRGTASIERARAELGWEPKVPLVEGLRRSADWAHAQGLV